MNHSKGATLFETIIAITCGSILLLAIFPWIPHIQSFVTKAETQQSINQNISFCFSNLSEYINKIDTITNASEDNLSFTIGSNTGALSISQTATTAILTLTINNTPIELLNIKNTQNTASEIWRPIILSYKSNQLQPTVNPNDIKLITIQITISIQGKENLFKTSFNIS